MYEARRLGVVGLITVLVAGFCWAAWEMIVAPLASGTAYPDYSSLRTDPHGTQALFESLNRLPELTVRRSFKAPAPLSEGTTLLVLGLEANGLTSWPTGKVEEYERLVHAGGRLVFGFLPATAKTRPPAQQRNTDSKPEVEARWDVHVRFATAAPAVISDPHETALYFEAGPEWTVLRENHNGAVLLERPMAGGSIVLVADSFDFSNQSLADHPEPELLSRIVGDSRRIEFDENHLGIAESGSVATLGRKYHLELPVVMALVAAFLYLWRSSASFLPPRPPNPNGALDGRDSQVGMVALLRRSIPERKLMDECLDQWRRTARPATIEKLAALTSDGDAATTYRAAYRILRGKRD